MDVADLDYELPAAAIAQHPIEPRDAARLLVDRGDQEPAHRTVADLPELLEPGDLVVVNDTRVRRARLALRKPTGGAVEVLLLVEHAGAGAPASGDAAGAAPATWIGLVRPSRKVPPGTELSGDGGLVVRVGADLGGGQREVVVLAGDPEAVGQVPLPPYIHEALGDDERYQTVFNRNPSSAAAPTAGLHLTHGVLDRLGERGIGVRRVELAVGLDTFRPIGTDRVEDHPMHTERYEVDPAVWADVERTRAAGRRVVAIGTTVVRTLESVAATGELAGATDLFIRPGFRFRVVDRMLTNFHVPRTTLLALVHTFTGGRWRHLYDVALADGYRFLSFGDAMLLTRSPVDGAEPGRPASPGPA